MHYFKTCIIDLVACRNSKRIFVQRNQSSLRAQFFQYQSTVTATPECAVHIDTFGFDLQSFNCLIQQYSCVNQILAQRVKPSSSGGRSPSLKPDIFSFCACQRASSHNSNLFPCPTNITRLSSNA